MRLAIVVEMLSQSLLLIPLLLPLLKWRSMPPNPWCLYFNHSRMPQILLTQPALTQQAKIKRKTPMKFPITSQTHHAMCVRNISLVRTNDVQF